MIRGGNPDEDELIARWVVAKLGQNREPLPKPPWAAAAVEQNGKIIAGFVAWRWIEDNIEISVAAERAAWCRPLVLRQLFGYLFDVLKCRRVTAFIDRSNSRARRLAEGVGFRHEGTLRQWLPYGSGDACVYGMLREDCRWLTGSMNGQHAKPAENT